MHALYRFQQCVTPVRSGQPDMTPKRPTRLAAELAELAEESKIDNTQPSIQKVEHTLRLP